VKEQDLILAACKRLEVEPEQIAGHALIGEELVILVNYGIGGIKKYRISTGDLLPAEAPAPIPAPEPEPTPAPQPEQAAPKPSRKRKK
jgi:hypothetical protein